MYTRTHTYTHTNTHTHTHFVFWQKYCVTGAHASGTAWGFSIEYRAPQKWDDKNPIHGGIYIGTNLREKYTNTIDRVFLSSQREKSFFNIIINICVIRNQASRTSGRRRHQHSI